MDNECTPFGKDCHFTYDFDLDEIRCSVHQLVHPKGSEVYEHMQPLSRIEMTPPSDQIREVFVFDIEYDSGRVVGLQVGRIYLGRGEHCARLYFLPDGIHMVMDEKAMKFIHTLEHGHFPLYSKDNEKA